VLADAVARDPKNAFLKGDLIRVEVEVDGVDSALAKAQAFAKDDPGNNIYDLISAELYEKAGRPKDAITLLRRLLRHIRRTMRSRLHFPVSIRKLGIWPQRRPSSIAG